MSGRLRAVPALCVLALTALPGGARPSSPPPPPAAWSLCAPCHGETGAGDGPAVDLLWPRPRDLHRASLKFGADPASLRRTLRRGLPGTAMPAFDGLPDETVAALVGYITAGRSPSAAPAPVDPGRPPADAPAESQPSESQLAESRSADALWQARCAACHGPDGAGDGPLAKGLTDHDGRPADLYDLRRAPLKGGATLDDLLRTLAHGRPGTAMAPVADPAERRALAAWVLDRRDPDPRPRWRMPPPGIAAQARDRHWAVRPLPDPGPRPAGPPLATAPSACAVCHPHQHQTWSQSRHAAAAGPGLLGQYHGADPAFIGRCNACHAPAAHQQADREALARGVTCAGCHLRAHRKLGPPGPSSVRIPAPGMAVEPTPRFARSDFCMPCHNLPLDVAVAGRPLLDTWREWAASPYLPAGVQCQHCHMPDGAHRVPGAHDAEMVRRAVRLEVERPTVADGRIEQWARVYNVGAGHHFPTTATPRAVLRIRQLGPDGPLPATAESWAIGRTVHHDGERWIEEADTRIPAGERRARRYHRPLDPAAERIEVSLHLFPDWFYARFYRARLAAELSPAARVDFEAALADAERSVILVDYVRLPISGARPPPSRRRPL